MPKKAQTCGAGNSVDIQCRIFANFKDETLKPVVHVAWSKFANFRNIAICTLPMMFPPLLPHLEAVFSVSYCGVRNGAELLRFYCTVFLRKTCGVSLSIGPWRHVRNGRGPGCGGHFVFILN